MAMLKRIDWSLTLCVIVLLIAAAVFLVAR